MTLDLNLTDLTPADLLALHSQVADELRVRGITRSANNPTGDLAEYLFCKAFGWKQAGNSHANIDAVGPNNTRYQIKGRRLLWANLRAVAGRNEIPGRQHCNASIGKLLPGK